MNAFKLTQCISLFGGLFVSCISLPAQMLSLELPGVGDVTFIAADNGGTEPVIGNTRAYGEDGTLTDNAWSNEPDGISPAEDVPLWRNRTTWGGVGAGLPGAFTHGEGNSQILPKLNTRIEVPLGSYDVYVVYGADNRRVVDPEADNAGGSVDAALKGEELVTYDYSNGIYIGVTGEEAIWGVFAAKLGTVFNATEISVDIDAPPLPEEGFYRPLYYGVAYLPAGSVVPSFADFVGASSAQGGYISPWFGSFTIFNEDYINHVEFGYLYISYITDLDNMWMWSETLSKWLWSSESLFPIFYDASDVRWITFFHIEDGSVFVFDYTTGIWSSVEP